jgi:polyisoprenoid-binding protein YceI
MKTLIILLLCSVIALPIKAQRYITKNGFISFYSHTPLEDIKADNNQVASIFDSSTGELVFQVLIKSFHFEKALMEEHFNENFMESDKFPRSEFKGRVINISAVDFEKPGIHEVNVEGDLTIRDVTKQITTRGTIEILNGSLDARAKFIVSPEDYGIKIPAVVRNNIARTIEVTVIMKYSLM